MFFFSFYFSTPRKPGKFRECYFISLEDTLKHRFTRPGIFSEIVWKVRESQRIWFFFNLVNTVKWHLARLEKSQPELRKKLKKTGIIQIKILGMISGQNMSEIPGGNLKTSKRNPWRNYSGKIPRVNSREISRNSLKENLEELLAETSQKPPERTLGKPSQNTTKRNS